MNFPGNGKKPFFLEVYSLEDQFLGAVYLNYFAHKWAIKEYPGPLSSKIGVCTNSGC